MHKNTLLNFTQIHLTICVTVTVERARNNKNLTRIVTSIVMTIAACVIIGVSLCNFAILRKKKLLEKILEGKTFNFR